ncbi:HPr family phosphocarrier protein [Cohnella thailandensis]|uniref:HPr family phosphocarrier protein n=1 Tax=Cohnella thailandensis TaxID=557557 RepID=A0A841SY54_9BACL|nr:HPr family phosphocarrier protein [Cohnella thailandensis]MBB6633681.1 HPr family phosphocarrier protein [Cohnella thailandensis]MBP1976466.1 phosphocarrier protein [Cohnella thailandensis]
MLTQTYTVIHPSGFHARPTKVFVHTATQYPCKVSLIKGTKKINAKSSLGLLSLGLKQGDEVTLEVDGEREAEALQELGALLTKIYEE